MQHIKEEDLEEFKITCRNRLDPDGATGFMMGSIVWVSLVISIIIYGLVKYGWGIFSNSFEQTIVKIELILYSIQIVFLIFYLFPKMRFKFQKLQTIVVLLYAFQLATIGFVPMVVPSIFGFSSDSITLICVCLLLVGAIITHIVFTIDTFKQAREGAFRIENMSISFFNERKIRIVKGNGIYVLLLIIIIYVNNYYTYSLTDIFFNFILCVILYAVAVGAAEFQLLAYCRFKFPSFHISWEEHERNRKRFVKRNKKHLRKQKRRSR